MSSMKKDASTVDWTQLPDELLGRVNKRLSLLDLIRCSSVCSTWKYVSSPEIHHRKNHSIWLILPNVNNSGLPRFLGWDRYRNKCNRQDHYYRDGMLRFYSIMDGIAYKVQILEGYRICGSSFGWLITIGVNSDMQLFHPFTGKVLDLPSFMANSKRLRYKYSVENGIVYNGTIDTISHSPNIVIIICRHLVREIQETMFFTRPGMDDSWIEIEGSSCYKDMAFFKGEYYSLSNSGLAVLKGLNGSCPPTTSELISYNEVSSTRLVATPSGILKVLSSVSLVATRCDLLKVTRIYTKSGATLRFVVHNADFGDKIWVEIETIGNSALFIGLNESFSVVASDIPGCRENCIYFCIRGDKGVFNLVDGSIKPICSSDSKFVCPCPVWFSGNP